MLNYQKLMDNNPTEYERFTNSLGQEIVFYEHPFKGDESEILVVCHNLKLACYSGFFETNDMLKSHKEYEPTFVDSRYYVGGYEF
jgi:hypothetical protein